MIGKQLLQALQFGEGGIDGPMGVPARGFFLDADYDQRTEQRAGALPHDYFRTAWKMPSTRRTPSVTCLQDRVAPEMFSMPLSSSSASP